MDDFYNKIKRFSLLYYFSLFLFLLSNSPKEKEKSLKTKAYFVGLLKNVGPGWSRSSKKELSHEHS